MDVVSRLKYFMDSSGLTISQFADTCNIPRPTMSQLISGRNKRISNEIFDKIHNGFPNLSILWLMFGEGQMLVNENIEISEPQNAILDNDLVTERADDERVGSLQSSFFASSESFQSGNEDEHSSKNAGSGTNFAEEVGKAYISDKAEQPRQAVYFSEDVPSKANIDDIVLSSNPHSEISVSDSNTPLYSARSGAVDHAVPSQPPHSNQQFQQSGQQSPIQSPNHETAHVEAHRVSIAPDSHKKITNIVVFYSDNSFQSFLPDM
jgi:putative transcriptional regulator